LKDQFHHYKIDIITYICSESQTRSWLMIGTLKQYSWIFLLLLISFNSCTFDSESSSTSVSETALPHNPTPAINATDITIKPTFKWESDNTAYYDIILDTNNPPSPASVNSQVLLRQSSKSITFSKLLSYNTDYYWRVYAYTSDGSMTEGPVWKFSTLATSLNLLNGYAMYQKKIRTASPDTVEVVFQVVDMNKRGVTNLTSTDFDVYEDGAQITSESALKFSKYAALNLKIYTILMIDNSTSLTSNNLDQIKTQAKNYVTKYITKGGQQLVKVYKFSEKVEELFSDYKDDPATINAAIDNITAGVSSTDLYGAVVEGAAQLNNQETITQLNKGVLILFTDGSDTQGSTSLASALSAADNKLVFTIGLGNEIQPDILSAIGTSGFFSISQTSQFQSSFEEIQNILLDYTNSFYKLIYLSPKRGNFTHLLTIMINNNVYTGNDSFLQSTYNSSGF
jgi:hypothetical protein